jgi:hypothetical protein
MLRQRLDPVERCIDGVVTVFLVRHSVQIPHASEYAPATSTPGRYLQIAGPAVPVRVP